MTVYYNLDNEDLTEEQLRNRIYNWIESEFDEEDSDELITQVENVEIFDARRMHSNNGCGFNCFSWNVTEQGSAYWNTLHSNHGDDIAFPPEEAHVGYADTLSGRKPKKVDMNKRVRVPGMPKYLSDV